MRKRIMLFGHVIVEVTTVTALDRAYSFFVPKCRKAAM